MYHTVCIKLLLLYLLIAYLQSARELGRRSENNPGVPRIFHLHRNASRVDIHGTPVGYRALLRVCALGLDLLQHRLAHRLTLAERRKTTCKGRVWDIDGRREISSVVA